MDYKHIERSRSPNLYSDVFPFQSDMKQNERNKTSDKDVDNKEGDINPALAVSHSDINVFSMRTIKHLPYGTL